MTDLPPEYAELVTKHREKIEALASAGVFDTPEGKVTVHMHDGFVQGVQIEAWTFQRRRQLSTPKPQPKSPLL